MLEHVHSGSAQPIAISCTTERSIFDQMEMRGEKFKLRIRPDHMSYLRMDSADGSMEVVQSGRFGSAECECWRQYYFCVN